MKARYTHTYENSVYCGDCGEWIWRYELNSKTHRSKTGNRLLCNYDNHALRLTNRHKNMLGRNRI